MSLDHHEGTYLKLAVKRYAPRTLRETAEGRYWRAYKSPALIHQVSQVTSVAFAVSGLCLNQYAHTQLPQPS